FHELEFCRLLMCVRNFYAACGQCDRIGAQKVAVMDEYVEAKPVRPKHATRGKEADRDIDDAFKVFSCHPGEALTDALGPGHASNQWIIQSAFLEWLAACEVAELQHLQQDRSIGQVGDIDFQFRSRKATQLDVQLGRPFALELFAGQSQP